MTTKECPSCKWLFRGPNAHCRDCTRQAEAFAECVMGLFWLVTLPFRVAWWIFQQGRKLAQKR